MPQLKRHRSPEAGRPPFGSGARRLETRPAVLVVDDDFDTLSGVQQVLVDSGYPTAVADSGEQALAFLESGVRPSLVLVDLMMPRIDGWQLIARIRDLGLPGLTIVSMTAGDRLMEAPVSAAYLQKPLNWDELLRIVRRHCGSPREADQIAHEDSDPGASNEPGDR